MAGQIQAFLDGRMLSFPPHLLHLLRLDPCPPFRRQVLLAVSAIPRGRVSSYGRLAARLNNPGAARAVGTAMATNPFPLIIPCHRVIRSDGGLGEFGSGQAMKKALLEMEGVAFQTPERISKVFFWG